MSKISKENLIIINFRNEVDESWSKVDDKIESIYKQLENKDNEKYPALFLGDVRSLIYLWRDYSQLQSYLDDMLDISEGVKSEEEVLNPEDDDSEES